MVEGEERIGSGGHIVGVQKGSMVEERCRKGRRRLQRRGKVSEGNTEVL